MRDAFDVAIVGGGPAGSTCGCLLKKYMPSLRVGIFEKEAFPREHVGESQLPMISLVLAEMGVWDKVEAAGFPIKLGASYRWGQSPELWDFDFIPGGIGFKDEPRPAAFAGQRRWTAFQVERSVYDKILLDHARELGAEVSESCPVRSVERDGNDPDTVSALCLGDGRRVTARHYVDASARAGVIRRAMGVGVTEPGSLKNVAFWAYWENAEWAVTIGRGGTRVFVLSIGCGWIWFIPIRDNRVSIGFVCPADVHKQSGRSPEETYLWALSQEPLVQRQTRGAVRDGAVHATNDWSFLADRVTGSNWSLAGEACGFADPILAGGMMLTHAGARELAYVILALERGDRDAAWLREWYGGLQRRRIRQHIAFADFWYAGNGQFTDLQDRARAIASESGIEMTPDKAFAWLSNGGFLEEIPGRAGIGGVDLGAAKQITGMFTGVEDGATWQLNNYNIFKPRLAGTSRSRFPTLHEGRIIETKALKRDERSLPLVGHTDVVMRHVARHPYIWDLVRALQRYYASLPNATPQTASVNVQQAMMTLEALLVDGWVDGSLDPAKRTLAVRPSREHAMIHSTTDVPTASEIGAGDAHGP